MRHRLVALQPLGFSQASRRLCRMFPWLLRGEQEHGDSSFSSQSDPHLLHTCGLPAYPALFRREARSLLNWRVEVWLGAGDVFGGSASGLQASTAAVT